MANLGSENTPIEGESVSTESLSTDWMVDAGDFDTLQDAVDAAESSNARLVKVPSGTYNEEVLVLNEPLIIEGNGEDTLIDGGNERAFAVNQPVVLRDLSLNSDGDNTLRLGSDSDGALIDNVSILGSGGNGVDTASAADSLKLRELDVSPCDGNEIEVDADNCSVIGCIVEGEIVDAGTNNSIPSNGNGNVII